MNALGISTDPGLLDVELPHTLIESPSVSTFLLPDEEASICPLLSNTNGTSTPLTFSHPLTPCNANDNDSLADTSAGNHLRNEEEDAKVETSSSSGSSSGIGMDAPDNAQTTLFNKHAYQHLQINNGQTQDTNGHGPNGNLKLSKETPSFVSWNWPLIRKCTFFVFMSSLLAMCAIVVAMIVTLPKICNPETTWYRGGVFYEIFPASFQDSNNDGLGDIHGIRNRVDYLASLGIAAVRLNSIFPTPHYPEDYKNITSLTEIASVLGKVSDLQQLVESLHARNISLILDLPIGEYVRELGKVTAAPVLSALMTAAFANDTDSTTTTPRPIVSDSLVSDAIRKWLKIGVDGFYIKGLENFSDDAEIAGNLAEWKHIIGTNRIIIVDEILINIPTILNHVDLVDVHLNVLESTKVKKQRIEQVLQGKLAPVDEGPWIHWSIGGVDKERISNLLKNANLTLAATIMQLMLPGTPSIFYGDEIALDGISDPHNEHIETKYLHHLAIMQWSNATSQFTNRETLPWLPQTASYTFDNFRRIQRMIELRNISPPIYKIVICKAEVRKSNTKLKHSNEDILVIERTYPRRNTFVAVSNFGEISVTLDMTSMYYSGSIMSGVTPSSDKIYFRKFSIGPLETIVVKLDK